MDNQKRWGIAMDSCGEYIREALLTACMNHSIDINNGDEEIFHYIEIGVAEGLTVARVCDFLKYKVGDYFKVTAVDILGGWSLNMGEYAKNIAEYKDKITLDLDGSPSALAKMREKSVNAIMIDGDHSFKAVKDDFAEADRIIKKGGVIMFHDSDILSQNEDISHNQEQGIEVRKAIESLDLSKYILLSDYQPTEQKEGEEVKRGIYIIQKAE